MARIMVAGRAYPYPDPTSITFEEAKTIKDRLGISMVNILVGLERGEVDEDTMLALFIVAKLRSDGDIDLSQVMNLPLTDMTFVPDEPEPDEEKSVSPPEPVESGPSTGAKKKKSSAVS